MDGGGWLSLCLAHKPGRAGSGAGDGFRSLGDAGSSWERREDNLMQEGGGKDSKANPFSSPLGAMFYSAAALLTRWDLPGRL